MLGTSIPVLMDFAKSQSMDPLLVGMIWTFAAGGKLFAYQSAVLIVGMSYGYFNSRDLFRLGVMLTLVECVLVLLVVTFYWPLIGFRCHAVDNPMRGRCGWRVPVCDPVGGAIERGDPRPGHRLRGRRRVPGRQGSSGPLHPQGRQKRTRDFLDSRWSAVNRRSARGEIRRPAVRRRGISHRRDELSPVAAGVTPRTHPGRRRRLRLGQTQHQGARRRP